MPPRYTVESFWAKMRRTASGCLEWPGYKSGGYGIVTFQGQLIRAHRLAWELTYGPIPEELCVLHHCDNPPCCEPTHLFLGTRADNNHDRDNKGRHWQDAKTHCPKGHPLEGDNLYLQPPTEQHPRGVRSCRLCRAERDEMRRTTKHQEILAYQRAWKKKRRGPPQSRRKSHCHQGHPLDGDNLYWSPDGRRTCRACRLERKRRWRAKQKS